MDDLHGGDVGYICDGQLAAMGVMAAHKRGLHPVVFGTSETASAAQAIIQGTNDQKVGTSIISNKGDTMAQQYLSWLKQNEFSDALKNGAPVAFDWENAPTEALQSLEKRGLQLKPGWEILQTTQHRGREKRKINEIHGSTITAEYTEVQSLDNALYAFANLGPGRLKTCEGGYDGKGQWSINSEADLENVFQEFEGKGDIPELVYEQNVPFTKEASVIVGRNSRGELAWYDPFLNHHEGGILRTTHTGNIGIDKKVCDNMIDFTKRVAEGLGLEGIMCMEMFLLPDGSFKANEIAARAHNSGHITRSTHSISQFDLQIMAMLDEKMPGHILNQASGVMTNFIGNDIDNLPNVDWGTFGGSFQGNAQVMSYGKGEAKDGRKMGHKEVLR